MFNRFNKKVQPNEIVPTDLEYEDLLKIEFVDMISKFQQDRKSFHIYSIGRCATTATLVGFSYSYEIEEYEGQCYIIKTIHLNEYGELQFKIASGTNYGTILTENRVEVVQNLIDTFPTKTKVTKRCVPNKLGG